MKITEKEVRYVADLANLRFTDPEVAQLRAELDGILDHMDKLKEIDTTGVEPMAQALFAEEAAEPDANLRSDTPIPSLGNDVVLARAPQSGAGHFKVPKVIER